MQNIIWHRTHYKTVDIDKPPTDSKMLDMFLMHNEARLCFFKTNGYWWKLKMDGILEKVCPALYNLSLKQWLEIALKDEK